MSASNYDYTACRLCPRNCGADRTRGLGFCGCPAFLRAARAALHYYEEPFISGSEGSGAIFFSGCNLMCVYCQNKSISAPGGYGIEVSAEGLGRAFLRLQEQGANNINLVTGTPYIPMIADALDKVKDRLDIPVVWNSSGYECVKSLEIIGDYIDIWLPDFKTLSPELGKRYMNAPDYPEYASRALEWMVRKTGKAAFADNGMELSDMADISENSLMKSGVCVRHLAIPGQGDDSKAVLKYLHESFGDDIWISLMSQYTPMRSDFEQQELNRKLSAKEYDELTDYAIAIGIEQCMIQDGDVADESFVPLFDGTGLI